MKKRKKKRCTLEEVSYLGAEKSD